MAFECVFKVVGVLFAQCMRGASVNGSNRKIVNVQVIFVKCFIFLQSYLKRSLRGTMGTLGLKWLK